MVVNTSQERRRPQDSLVATGAIGPWLQAYEDFGVRTGLVPSLAHPRPVNFGLLFSAKGSAALDAVEALVGKIRQRPYLSRAFVDTAGHELMMTAALGEARCKGK